MKEFWNPILFIEITGFTLFLVFGFFYIVNKSLNKIFFPYSARISAIGLIIFIWTIYLKKYNLI